MIDLKTLREDPEAFRRSLGKKRYEPGVFDRVVEFDAEKRKLLTQVEAARAERKKVSKQVGKASPEEREALMARSKEMATEVAHKEKRLAELTKELDILILQIPNPPAFSVPDADSEEGNEVLRTEGKPPHFDFEPRDHVALGEITGTIDIPRAARACGSRFSYIFGELVHLEFALVQYAIRSIGSRGFRPVVTPVMVREQAMFGTGFFPADRNEVYKLEDEDLYLVGTSEVTLAALHMDEILAKTDLPLRYGGFSTCFRREAGAHGKDTRGMFRVHQFDKVEMFSFCRPDQSEKEHELIRETEEAIVGGLGLPYQVVNIAAGDLGAPAARKYDIEAWFPGHGKYREITSCSNCTDYQARRLKVRYKDEYGKNRLCHTLNGTAVAVGRTIIAIMTNFQEADGAIALPAVLHPFLPENMTRIEPIKKK